MKKINTILAAVGALLMLTVTGANSVEFKAGVSANGMAAYANAKETLKGDGAGTGGQTGRTTNEEAVLATSFASVFAEISSEDMMGLGIGVFFQQLRGKVTNEMNTTPTDLLVSRVVGLILGLLIANLLLAPILLLPLSVFTEYSSFKELSCAFRFCVVNLNIPSNILLSMTSQSNSISSVTSNFIFFL